ncbi:U6 snRNA-associated Sm-like protein LSm2 [Dissophora globulifera]|uniref:U6 snRNA-associated Sm-like protein LSm2 n=1 Tax=Dissophora globulifera TaxID=979702 RepID=A0A9P6RQG2_9FUNG|nr:U6 snRNA-associated Sm-like protein LSm2 [Dissophora globulifera]
MVSTLTLCRDRRTQETGCLEELGTMANGLWHDNRERIFLFYSFFKTLVGQPVTVELKNDLAITGVLVSVDQFLNIKLDNIKVVDEERYPHMLAVKNCFIRGSVVRYVQLPAPSVDTALLQDAARRERQQPAAVGRK